MIRLPSVSPISGVYPTTILSIDNSDPILFPSKPMIRENYTEKQLRMKNGKLTEDVYAYTIRNGKKREKKTHRVIPLRKPRRKSHKRVPRLSSPPPPLPPSPSPLSIPPLTKHESTIHRVKPHRSVAFASPLAIQPPMRPVSSMDDRMPTSFPSKNAFADTIHLVKRTPKPHTRRRHRRRRSHSAK